MTFSFLSTVFDSCWQQAVDKWLDHYFLFFYTVSLLICILESGQDAGSIHTGVILWSALINPARSSVTGNLVFGRGWRPGGDGWFWNVAVPKAGLSCQYRTRRSLIKGETGFSFPQKERLKKRDEIREVFNRKRAVSCSGAKLLTLQNGLHYNRIAFAFPRKFGNAVERNYSRRLSREVYRLMRNELRKGYDIVLFVYPGQDSFSIRTTQLRQLFSRAGLLSSSRE